MLRNRIWLSEVILQSAYLEGSKGFSVKSKITVLFWSHEFQILDNSITKAKLYADQAF